MSDSTEDPWKAAADSLRVALAQMTQTTIDLEKRLDEAEATAKLWESRANWLLREFGKQGAKERMEQISASCDAALPQAEKKTDER